VGSGFDAIALILDPLHKTVSELLDGDRAEDKESLRQLEQLRSVTQLQLWPDSEGFSLKKQGAH
jgi:hypothetical protein